MINLFKSLVCVGMLFFFASSAYADCGESEAPSVNRDRVTKYYKISVGEICRLDISTKNEGFVVDESSYLSDLVAKTNIQVSLKKINSHTFRIEFKGMEEGKHYFQVTEHVRPLNSMAFSVYVTYEVEVTKYRGGNKASNAPGTNNSQNAENNNSYLAYPNTTLCRQTLNPQNNNFEVGPNYIQQLREVRRRNLSVEDCKRLLGL